VRSKRTDLSRDPGSAESRERGGQFGERCDDEPCLGRVVAPGLDPRPRAAPDEDREHPGRRGRPDVVVDAIADIRDLSGDEPELGGDPRKEGG